MKALDQLISKFNKLALRERLLAVAALTAVVYFILNMALLEPQNKKVKELQRQAEAHKTEVVALNAALAQLDDPKSTGSVTNFAAASDKDRATFDELKKEVADIDAFLAQSDPTTSQAGDLVRQMLSATPGLTLVSLRTLPVTEFFIPKKEPSGPEHSANVSNDLQKALYKSGVQVSVKGDYMALLAYLQNLQKSPKRLFWSDTNFDSSSYPNSTLSMTIYILDGQSNSPLH